MPKGLKERILSATALQKHLNGWPYHWRLRMPDHERLMAKLLRRASLETYCTACGRVWDTAVNHIDCKVCGSRDTTSQYYC